MKSPVRILVIDDEPGNLRIIEEIFDYEENIVYKTAESGEQGMVLLKQFCPDIVVLDVMMPGMSGYDMCRLIREDPETKDIKVIMASGRAMEAERLGGLAAGADEYIFKPFSDDLLLEKINSLMGQEESE